MNDPRHDHAPAADAPAGDVKGSAPPGAPGCSECASANMTLISDSDLVAIYKCPRCGHLSAPVKGH